MKPVFNKTRITRNRGLRTIFSSEKWNRKQTDIYKGGGACNTRLSLHHPCGNQQQKNVHKPLSGGTVLKLESCGPERRRDWPYEVWDESLRGELRHIIVAHDGERVNSIQIVGGAVVLSHWLGCRGDEFPCMELSEWEHLVAVSGHYTEEEDTPQRVRSLKLANN